MSRGLGLTFEARKLAKDGQPGESMIGQPIEGGVEGFKAAMIGLDRFLPKVQFFEVSLRRNNAELRWEHPANKTGGKFSVLFAQNTVAFRTFCVFAHDWIQNRIEFGDSIVGISAIMRNPRQWKLQIWVNDGYDPSRIAPRWAWLKTWMLAMPVNDFRIGFNVHPNYRAINPPKGSQVLFVESFAKCIARANGVEIKDDVARPEAPRFDIKVATIHKRKWSERRPA